MDPSGVPRHTPGLARTVNKEPSRSVLEGILLLSGATLSVVIGTWLIGELSPKIGRRRTLHNYELVNLAAMKHDLQRTTVQWLSGMAASIIGAYKLKDVVDLVIAAVK